MWTISLLFSKITETLFPRKCFICKISGPSLCESCLRKCTRQVDKEYLYITSIYSFRDPSIKKIIHAIKYFRRKDLIEPLTRELIQELKRAILPPHITKWTLVPIPMPKLRKYSRGYNQAELIAREISKQCEMSLDINILTRKMSPKRQVKTTNYSERIKNQRNSFTVVKNIPNLHIILVDDVTTTGATLSEARNSLLRAGAKEVKAITIAH